VEFADLQHTFRMYSDRGFNLVTVAANTRDEKASALKFLERKHATRCNLLFACDDTAPPPPPTRGLSAKS
jgi:hypothetical protein